MKKGGQQGNNPFAAMFGGGGGGHQRGPDFKTYYDVTLAELYNGAQKTMQITRNVICRACKGSGAKDGKTNKCRTCKGTGHVMKLQRLGPGFNVQMQSPCDKCGGKGKTPVSVCPKCRGAKVGKEPKMLKIEIERGMPDGYNMVHKRAGEQSPSTTPGDVILVFKTKKHAFFTRQGHNLRMDMTISLKQALLGFTKTFTHLDGRQVSVKNKLPVTYPDYVLKLPGEGMPHHEFPSEKGDLYITFKIKFPRDLNPAQKKAIEELL
jgi:DnaJ-class molecular chaperone